MANPLEMRRTLGNNAWELRDVPVAWTGASWEKRRVVQTRTAGVPKSADGAAFRGVQLLIL
jgi:hypothetical protein